MNGQPWYRDREALEFVALRYLPWLAVLNLLWEIAQLPLYTIWTSGTIVRRCIRVEKRKEGHSMQRRASSLGLNLLSVDATLSE